MGASVYPHAIIGLRVPYSTVFEKATVKAYEHNHPPEWKRDPISGRDLWREEDVPRGSFTKHFEKYEEHVQFGPYPVETLKYERTPEFCYIVLAQVQGDDGCENGGGKRVPCPDAWSREVFERTLRTAGLWDENEFGLWADSYCSY